MQCVDARENEDVKVNVIENSFVFRVETTSGLSPEDIIFGSADILDGKMKEFSSAIKKLK
jgi:hypothetical protein